MPYRILAINPGSTSTKFALYDGENQILAKSLNHSIKELSKFIKSWINLKCEKKK